MTIVPIVMMSEIASLRRSKRKKESLNDDNVDEEGNMEIEPINNTKGGMVEGGGGVVQNVMIPSKTMDSNDGKQININQSSTLTKKTGDDEVLKGPTGLSKVSIILLYLNIKVCLVSPKFSHVHGRLVANLNNVRLIKKTNKCRQSSLNEIMFLVDMVWTHMFVLHCLKL